MAKNKLIFFIVAIVSIGIAAFILFSGKTGVNINGRKVTLNIIGTSSNGGFFEDARKEFASKNPDIEVNYIIIKGTFKAVDYILEGNDVDGWICADETGTDLLINDYSKEHGKDKIVIEASPIVASPLVIVGWEERMAKLGDLSVSKLYEIVSQGKTWESLGGDADWGFVNFSHTNPVDSNSGVQFITLLAHEFYKKNGIPKKSLGVGDIASSDFVEYVRTFEKNTAKQEDGSAKFMENLILYGPSRYDMGAIYEYYALSSIKDAQGRWGNLKIVYPNPTIWSNRPFVILNGKNSSKEKIDACKKFRDFLVSPETQKKAMSEGFRPANMEVTDLSDLENDYGKYGFKKNISSAVPGPDIKVIESIQSMIKRIQ